MNAVLAVAIGAIALLGADDGGGDGAVVPDDAAEALFNDDVMERIQSLDLQERVAQLMLVTLHGAYGPNAEDREMLKEAVPGGVIIPATNEPRYAAEYVSALRCLPVEAQSGIPLFIGANLYALTRGVGGKGATFQQLPSPLAIAAAGDAESVERLADLVAEYYTLLGFNMSVGPSLELAPMLPDASGGILSFGNDPAFVANAGGALVAALREKGLIALPLGFPGGGFNRTVKSPAALLTPRALLMEQDALPYRRVVADGARMVHVANTLVATVDPQNRPASLSPVVMRDLLREEVGFDGVIVAGPMDASDISRLQDPALAAIHALAAGADMVYWEGKGVQFQKGVAAVCRAVQAGTLSDTVVNAALARVLALKEEAGLRARKLPKASEAEKLVRNRHYQEEAYEIERRSVTLVQNRGDVLPLTQGRSMPIGVTGTVGVEALRDQLQKHLKPISMQIISTARHLGRIEDFEIHRATSHIRGIRTVICLFTETRRMEGHVALVRELKDKGVTVVVALLGYPKHLADLADADAILLAYPNGNAIGASIKAISDALVGHAPLGLLGGSHEVRAEAGKVGAFSVLDLVRAPAGRLPVTVAEPYVAGYAVAYDPSLAIKKAEWDFADGERAKGLQVTHAFAAAGRYPVSLTITDVKGGTTEAGVVVCVE